MRWKGKSSVGRNMLTQKDEQSGTHVSMLSSSIIYNNQQNQLQILITVSVVLLSYFTFQTYLWWCSQSIQLLQLKELRDHICGNNSANLRRTHLNPSHSGGSKAPVSWQLIWMNGVANLSFENKLWIYFRELLHLLEVVAHQSWSKTSPSGQTKVRLKATGGAGSISIKQN